MNNLIIIFSLFILILFFYSYNNKKNKEEIKIKIKDAQDKINKLKNIDSINDSFNDIPKFYLNLKRSEDREINIQKEIQKYNIKNIERIESFDGKNIDNIRKGKINDYTYINNSFFSCTKSELAITMSHILAIKEAYNRNYQNVIIMEDDIEFFLLPKWNIDFNNLINQLPEDCDILLLAHQHHGDLKIFSKRQKNVRVSGVCYLVTRKGMEKLNKYLNNKTFKFDKSLYNIVWDTNIMNNLNIYHTNKSLFLLFNFKFYSDKEEAVEDFFCNDSYSLLNNYIID